RWSYCSMWPTEMELLVCDLQRDGATVGMWSTDMWHAGEMELYVAWAESGATVACGSKRWSYCSMWSTDGATVVCGSQRWSYCSMWFTEMQSTVLWCYCSVWSRAGASVVCGLKLVLLKYVVYRNLCYCSMWSRLNATVVCSLELVLL
ncbi:hypothetical protein Hamer_G019554, partial [Homarus americanus]